MEDLNIMGLPPIPSQQPNVDPITGSTMGGPTDGDKQTKKPRSPKIKAPKQQGAGAKGVAIVVAALVGVVGFGGIVAINLLSTPETVNVYRLVNDVAANQVISSDDLEVVKVEKDIAPSQPITEEDLSAGGVWFARLSYPAGTILQDGLIGTELRTLTDYPVGTALGSLTVDPERAVAGRVQAGSYVNIYSTGKDPSGELVTVPVLTNMSVVNVQPSLDVVARAGGSIEDARKPGPGSALAFGGIANLYTFALTPEQAAILAAIQDSDNFLVLTTENAPAPTAVVSAAELFAAVTTNREEEALPEPESLEPDTRP
jgi:Flp pilus assembly protein CpaB